MGGAPAGRESTHSLVGQVICDRWRVLGCIGQGGTSTVYEARETRPTEVRGTGSERLAPDGRETRDGRPALEARGDVVAIKVLDRALAANERARRRFLREARLADAVGHPDAVRVFEHGETSEGLLLLVMERLRGETLGGRCRRAPMAVAEVIDVACRVLEVLAAAHAKGIVHRDIKPENVFLTRAGEVKVLDFGIASLRDEAGRDEAGRDARLTQSGAALGTPAFMAPEQARGRHAGIDGRTDLWSVGATMFYCLSGRRVHEEAESANEALIFAATQRAPSLARFRPDVPATLARAVDRALALAPDERWPSAKAMRAALLDPACAATLSDAASESSLDDTGDPFLAPVVASPPARRTSAALGVVGLASLVVAACAALTVRGVVRPDAPAPPAQAALTTNVTLAPFTAPAASPAPRPSPGSTSAAEPVASTPAVPPVPARPPARAREPARPPLPAAPGAVASLGTDPVAGALFDRRK
jgi:serine/threonine protein kinase